MIRAGALDIAQPDASRCGGISETWKVARMAQQNGLGVATHSWSNAHVVSAMPNGITVEIDQMTNPFVEELLGEPLQIQSGQLQLSRAPGLGIELDMSVVDRYRISAPLNIPDGV